MKKGNGMVALTGFERDKTRKLKKKKQEKESKRENVDFTASFFLLKPSPVR